MFLRVNVGNALLYHLKPLKFFTILVDNREEFANKEQNPKHRKNFKEERSTINENIFKAALIIPYSLF